METMNDIVRVYTKEDNLLFLGIDEKKRDKNIKKLKRLNYNLTIRADESGRSIG